VDCTLQRIGTCSALGTSTLATLLLKVEKIRSYAPGVEGLRVESPQRSSSVQQLSTIRLADRRLDSIATLWLRRHGGAPSLARPPKMRRISNISGQDFCSGHEISVCNRKGEKGFVY
jgi:hypothetical protein